MEDEDTAPRSDEEPPSEGVIAVEEETPTADVDVMVVAPASDNGQIAALEARVTELEQRLAALEEYDDDDEGRSEDTLRGDGRGNTPETLNPITTGREEEERPQASHFWFRRLW